MVIYNGDFGRSLVGPTKDNTPLGVDPDGVASLSLTQQYLKVVSWWDRQIIQSPSLIELDQFTERDPGDGGKASISLFLEELSGVAIREGLNHKKGPR